MISGFACVAAIVSGLPNGVAKIFGMTLHPQRALLPVMEFPWWTFFGTIVTFLVAILFKSRPHVRPIAR
jgi:solute:Na+ symporter, SSS family